MGNNALIGCIYRQGICNVCVFCPDLMKNLLHLTGDFNIDLINGNYDIPTSTLCDNITSNQFVPQGELPARIT